MRNPLPPLRALCVLWAIALAVSGSTALADELPAQTVGPQMEKVRTVHLEYAAFAEAEHKKRIDAQHTNDLRAERRAEQNAAAAEVLRPQSPPPEVAAPKLRANKSRNRLGVFCDPVTPNAPRVPPLDARGRRDVRCVFSR